VHLQPAYSDLGYELGAFPQAEDAAKHVLSLPVYPELSSQAMTDVASAVKKAAARTIQPVVK
jgi:dTDP-4-amino-4,6-dideoxygalactose transaminase